MFKRDIFITTFVVFLFGIGFLATFSHINLSASLIDNIKTENSFIFQDEKIVVNCLGQCELVIKYKNEEIIFPIKDKHDFVINLPDSTKIKDIILK